MKNIFVQRKRHLFLVLFAFVVTFQYVEVKAQQLEDYNQVLIWRGMQHKWTYNHRANRLGSYVTMADGGKQCIQVQRD